MCGIAGVFGVDRGAAEHAVRVVNGRQAHRGPDGEGLQTLHVPGGCLALGHRRLSILDLSSAGAQPMTNDATGDWIVYNGEIYNYPQLRREFEGHGVRLQSRCDTEIILHAYARWGTGCFERLHGMFAIAFYDAGRQQLVLARDPLGIKPLYYSVSGRNLVFASEQRALRASGLVALEIDRRALAGLLAYGSVPSPLTMHNGIRLLEGGTCIQFDLRCPPSELRDSRPRRFWSFPTQQTGVSRREAIEQVRERLQHAVQSHLLSDVPVGVFLSAGMDSTAVAALSAASGDRSISTFTIRLADQPEMDEDPIASETSRLFRTRHHSVSLTEREVRDLAGKWFEALDQPSVDGLNTFIIAWAVRQHGMKVALSGLGGDEMFAGYKTFRQVPAARRWLRRASVLPPGMRERLAGWVFARKSATQQQKAREFMRTRPTVLGLALRRRRLFSDAELNALGFNASELGLTDDFLPPESEPSRDLSGRDDVSDISVIESRFYMGNTLLRDADVFGMAHGLEIRVPMLDRLLADYLLSLPGRLRARRGRANKPLMSDALGSNVFRDIPRQKKRGFSLPHSKWMSGPLREQFDALLQRTRDSGVVSSRGVDTVWDAFLGDQQGPTWSRAWILGVLGAWLQQQQRAENKTTTHSRVIAA